MRRQRDNLCFKLAIITNGQQPNRDWKIEPPRAA